MLSKSCEYAIRAVLYLSINSTEDNKIGIKTIAEDLKIPASFLSKILQKLVKHKLIHSSKGNTGGFYVEENINRQPIIAIVEIIDGLNSFQKCSMGLKQCSHKKPCVLHNSFQKSRNEMFNTLKKTSIMEMSLNVTNGLTYI